MQRRLSIIADTTAKLTPTTWAKGNRENCPFEKGQCCLMIAFCNTVKATGVPEYSNGTVTGDIVPRRALQEAVKRQFPKRIGGYHANLFGVEFNDHPDTTLDDVHLVLCGAARLIASGEVA